MSESIQKNDAVKTHLKQCSKCGEAKSVSEFGKRSSAKDGKNEWCRECTAESSRLYRESNREKVRESCGLARAKYRLENPGAVRESQRAWHKKNGEKLRARRRDLRRTDRWETLLKDSRHRAKQNGYVPCLASAEEIEAAFTGKCHVCGIPEIEMNSKLHLDHNHEAPGDFRGWLCSNCNRGLGHFQESETIIINALHYLMSQVSQPT